MKTIPIISDLRFLLRKDKDSDVTPIRWVDWTNVHKVLAWEAVGFDMVNADLLYDFDKHILMGIIVENIQSN